MGQVERAHRELRPVDGRQREGDRANDSAAALDAGGLVLVRDPDIALASEDLRIGLDPDRTNSAARHRSLPPRNDRDVPRRTPRIDASGTALDAGGLVLVRDPDIALASEDLRIGLDRITVDSMPAARIARTLRPAIALSRLEMIATSQGGRRG
jgi:hypothetical protein